MTMPDPDAVAEIARGLSKALKDIVIRMGDPKLPYGGIATFNLHPHMLGPLRSAELCRCEHQAGAYSPIERLTPLGLAIRDHLRTPQGLKP